jgi:anti-sigma factor RsiW
MKHPKEEELIAYHHGEPAERAGIGAHVADCPECRADLARIDALLAALNALPAPDPGEDYGARVWQQIAPKLPAKRRRRWNFLSAAAGPSLSWFAPQRLAAAGGIAMLVLAAFLAGRFTKRAVEPPAVADTVKVRERVLIMAVGEHLGRSEMVLVELANTEPQSPRQKRVNISGEQRRAEDLLQENRLYRQTALEQGDTALASVLDELERVLLDVAHSPEQLTSAQLEGMRQRIEARGILFKVRVVGEELQQRVRSTEPSPAQTSKRSERNKA